MGDGIGNEKVDENGKHAQMLPNSMADQHYGLYVVHNGIAQMTNLHQCS